ncbi:etoposide-induced protein 2.4-domain-containing protein [Pavlovales sp. CCMP2436]|nr:etoposide-induced protein 2.4-domain-containing protein [Pavlovales sp. CCMP2436]
MQIFVEGLQAATYSRRLLHFLWESERIRVRAFQCFVLNCLLFLGSQVVMEYLIMPAIISLLHLSPITSQAQQPVQRVLSLLYQLLWVYPAYFISFLVSCSWYEEIASRTYALHFGKRREVKQNFAGFVLVLRDEAWRFLLTYGFLLQTHALLHLVPYVGWVLHIVSLSWYWSFFCFEYKWSLHGWTIEQRVAAVEEQWLFLAGFGLPLALTSVAFSTFVSYGIVAFLFPLFVVLATISEPRVHTPSRWLPRRLPLFNLPKRLGLLVVRALSRRIRQPGHATAQQQAVGTGAARTCAE